MQFAQKRVIIRLQFRKQEGDGAMIKQFLRKYGWRYLPGVFFLVLNSYVLSLTPIYLGNAIDGLNRPASEIDKHYVYMQVLLLVIAAVGAFLTRYCWRYFINGNARNLEVFLRENLFVKYQNMPTSFFNSNKTGDLMALAINDIGAVRQTASMALANILTGCSTLFFAMLNMFSEIDWIFPAANPFCNFKCCIDWKESPYSFFESAADVCTDFWKNPRRHHGNACNKGVPSGR